MELASSSIQYANNNDRQLRFRTLSESLERTRKKYQSKLRRLEQQILQSLMKKQFGKSFDANSQSVYSCLSTETDQTED